MEFDHFKCMKTTFIKSVYDLENKQENNRVIQMHIVIISVLILITAFIYPKWYKLLWFINFNTLKGIKTKITLYLHPKRYKIKLSAFVKEKRNAAKLTQPELAEKSRCGIKVFKRTGTGQRNIKALQSETGITIVWLRNGAGKIRTIIE